MPRFPIDSSPVAIGRIADARRPRPRSRRLLRLGRKPGGLSRHRSRIGDMLGAGGTCEYASLTEYRRPASTRVTGFCACLRSGCSPSPESHARDHGARGCPCPGAGVADQRSQDGGAQSASSERRAGARSERPATGMGSPSRRGGPRSPSLTRLGFLTAAPSGAAREIPIAYAIGLPEGQASQRTAAVAPCPLVPQNETSMPRFRATAALSRAARSAPAASFA